MNDWFDFTLLSNPANWIIVTLVLIFVAYSAFLLAQNAGALTPSLKVVSTS